MSRARSRLAGSWAQARSWMLLVAVLVSTFAVTYTSIIRIKPLFAPDSTYYAATALWFSGSSKQEAVRQVTEWRHAQGWATPPIVAERMFNWGLVQPRVVLSALSVPFVKIWGIEGLVVVPGIALAVLLGLLTWMLGRRYGVLAAVATVVLMMASWRIMFYGSAMLTESLTALWGAMILAVAWRYQRRGGWSPVVWMIVLTIISGFTRQATLVPAGAFVAAWLAAVVLRRRPNGWGVPAIAVTVTSLAVQLLQNRLFPTFDQVAQVNQFQANTKSDSMLGAVRGAPALAWRIAWHDLTGIAGSDLPLLVLITLSIVSMVVFWRRSESHLLVGAILGIAVYNVATGSPTTFRYAMPGLAFFAVSVAMLAAQSVPAQHRPPVSDPPLSGREGGDTDDIPAERTASPEVAGADGAGGERVQPAPASRSSHVPAGSG